MLYEITYETGKKNVRADSAKEALESFKAQWEEFGDSAPFGWVTACWSEEI